MDSQRTTSGFALTTDVEKHTIPFWILPGQADTTVAKHHFENIKELRGIFSRMSAHEAQQKQQNGHLSF